MGSIYDVNSEVLDNAVKDLFLIPKCRYKTDIDVKLSKYPYKIDTHIIRNAKGDYDKTIKLRNYLNGKRETDKECKIASWIINDWGKLNTNLKNRNSSQNELKVFLDKCSRGGRMFVLRIFPHGLKCHRFFAKDRFFYDSKAIYSLNWIMLKLGCTHDFFPIPPGRSTAIIRYDMGTIVRLKLNNPDPFISKAEAYMKYCELINYWYNNHLSNMKEEYEPCEIEMRLFMAFDDIAQEVPHSLNVNFHNRPYNYK